jgi:hypothetical protein
MPDPPLLYSLLRNNIDEAGATALWEALESNSTLKLL